MRIEFAGDLFSEPEEMTYEIYMGDQLIRREVAQLPYPMHKMQWVSLCQQIAQENRPMKLRVLHDDEIWDQIEQKRKVLHNWIEFSNRAMEASV